MVDRLEPRVLPVYKHDVEMALFFSHSKRVMEGSNRHLRAIFFSLWETTKHSPQVISREQECLANQTTDQDLRYHASAGNRRRTAVAVKGAPGNLSLIA